LTVHRDRERAADLDAGLCGALLLMIGEGEQGEAARDRQRQDPGGSDEQETATQRSAWHESSLRGLRLTVTRASAPGRAGRRRRAAPPPAARGGWRGARRRTTGAAPSVKNRRRAQAGSCRARRPARGPRPPAAC